MKTEQPFVPGVDIPIEEFDNLWALILHTGTQELAGTAFLTGDSFTEADIDKLKIFYQKVLDYQENTFGEKGAVFNRFIREHLGLAEQIAVPMARVLNLDPYLLRALALTHDLGRLISHRRGRNDRIGEVLQRRLDMHEDFTSLLPSDDLWTETDKADIDKIL